MDPGIRIRFFYLQDPDWSHRYRIRITDFLGKIRTFGSGAFSGFFLANFDFILRLWYRKCTVTTAVSLVGCDFSKDSVGFGLWALRLQQANIVVFSIVYILNGSNPKSVNTMSILNNIAGNKTKPCLSNHEETLVLLFLRTMGVVNPLSSTACFVLCFCWCMF